MSVESESSGEVWKPSARLAGDVGCLGVRGRGRRSWWSSRRGLAMLAGPRTRRSLRLGWSTLGDDEPVEVGGWKGRDEALEQRV